MHQVKHKLCAENTLIMFILAYYQHTCYLQIRLLYSPSYVFIHVNVTFIVCMCVYLVLGDQVVYIFFIYHVGMPRKKKFYRIKNRYKKKKEQPSSPDPPDYNSDSTTCISTPSTSTAFGETSLDDTTPKNPLDVYGHLLFCLSRGVTIARRI